MEMGEYGEQRFEEHKTVWCIAYLGAYLGLLGRRWCILSANLNKLRIGHCITGPMLFSPQVSQNCFTDQSVNTMNLMSSLRCVHCLCMQHWSCHWRQRMSPSHTDDHSTWHHQSCPQKTSWSNSRCNSGGGKCRKLVIYSNSAWNLVTLVTLLKHILALCFLSNMIWFWGRKYIILHYGLIFNDARFHLIIHSWMTLCYILF